MNKINKEHGLISSVHKLRRTNHKDFQNCLFTCFLSQMETKKPVQALKDPSWVEAMQDELLQIEAIRLFLAYASFKDFIVYQMDVKSDFLYGKIEEEVYVDDIIFGSTKKELSTEFEKLMHDKFQISSIGELSFWDFSLTKALIKDEEDEEVDVHLYRSMIGSLMYLQLLSRLDHHNFCLCLLQGSKVTPKTSHLHVMKSILTYLKAQPKLGFWYPRDSPFDLEAFSNSKRGRDTKIPQSGGPPIKVGDEAVHKELGDRMERAATTASSLEAEQDSGSGPRCQDTILGDADAQTRFGTASIKSNDPPLLRGNTLRSGEDSMKLMELMAYCTKLSELVRKRKERCVYKNRKSELVRKRNERCCELKNRKRVCEMLFGMKLRLKLLLPVFVYAAKYTLTAVRHKLMLPGITYYCWIQALIDGKNIIVNEASIRRDLKLDDAEGSPCLPNATIFEELTRMGAKTTAWNEFSSTMASAIICLANNQKFNFSKYIFDSMDTPLFDTMMVQASEEVGEDSDHPTDSNQIPIVDQPSTSSKPKKKQKSRRKQRKEAEVSQDESAHEESVLDLEKTKTDQAIEIASLKKRVKKLEMKRKSRPEDPSKQGRNIPDIDQDVNVTLVDEAQEKLNDEDMFEVNDHHGEEVIVEDTTAPIIGEDIAAPTIPITTAEPNTIKAVTTAATSVTTAAVSRPKAKGIVFHDQEEQVSVSKPTISSTQPSIKDKGKAIMIEPERPLKRCYHDSPL
ncbi:putative ribonuclease H-like domain-containing protein [Tanacetum coccineum]